MKRHRGPEWSGAEDALLCQVWKSPKAVSNFADQFPGRTVRSLYSRADVLIQLGMLKPKHEMTAEELGVSEAMKRSTYEDDEDTARRMFAIGDRRLAERLFGFKFEDAQESCSQRLAVSRMTPTWLSGCGTAAAMTAYG